MAQYQDGKYLTRGGGMAFELRHPPGSEAKVPGIYRCVGCGDEIAVAKGHTLPPQNHHQHAVDAGKIAWQLVVFAQQKP